jgi:hypothetical protein
MFFSCTLYICNPFSHHIWVPFGIVELWTSCLPVLTLGGSFSFVTTVKNRPNKSDLSEELFLVLLNVTHIIRVRSIFIQGTFLRICCSSPNHDTLPGCCELLFKKSQSWIWSSVKTTGSSSTSHHNNQSYFPQRPAREHRASQHEYQLQWSHSYNLKVKAAFSPWIFLTIKVNSKTHWHWKQLFSTSQSRQHPDLGSTLRKSKRREVSQLLKTLSLLNLGLVWNKWS